MDNNFSFSKVLIIFTTMILFINCVEAKTSKKAKVSSCTPASVPTSLIIDSKTGRVLHAQNAKSKIFPASLAKLKTIKLAFEAIELGQLSWYKKLPVSAEAAKMPASKLGLKVGQTITVKDAVNALIVKSANDAAVVLAEAISGSEAKFVKLMNVRARQIGMSDTNFANASGWHHPNQKTTALDLAKLSMALKRDHPEFYPLFSQISFEYKGKVVHGHNHVMANYAGAEGLKTGFTCPSGFNLITAASRGNKALIGVVTGSNNKHHRDKKMVELLDKHFDMKTLPTTKGAIKKKSKALKIVQVKSKKRLLASS
jgi:D-alanyl-D-alanine carboxypeptidase (penicillin-binding protein 5/6)